MSQLFASGDQSIGVSPSKSVLPMNTQHWSPLGWTGWISLQGDPWYGAFLSSFVKLKDKGVSFFPSIAKNYELEKICFYNTSQNELRETKLPSNIFVTPSGITSFPEKKLLGKKIFNI